MPSITWSEMFPEPQGAALRGVIVRALIEVYDENVRRHAPEDLGDNDITFGVNVSQNLRHVVERDTAGFVDVECDRPRNSFVLRVREDAMVHFYKAPPGVTDIRALTFDESELKLDLRQENADQLSIYDLVKDNSSHTAMPSHVVIVHFGDPQTGFHYAEAGAPFTTATGRCDWVWHERLDVADGLLDAPRDEDQSGPIADPGLGLELRDIPDDEVGADDDQTGEP